jgi:hypothetical protein
MVMLSAFFEKRFGSEEAIQRPIVGLIIHSKRHCRFFSARSPSRHVYPSSMDRVPTVDHVRCALDKSSSAATEEQDDIGDLLDGTSSAQRCS